MSDPTDITSAPTLAEQLQRRARQTPDGEAYRQFEPAAQRWVSYTWQQIASLVARWRRALAAEGFEPGARVAILVPNCVEHVCMDQAALALGMVPVPLHATDNPESIAFILADSGASLLLVDSAQRWVGLAGLRAQFPALRRVVRLERSAAAADAPRAAPPDATALDAWLRAAESAAEPAPVAVGSDALAAIVYTSGTTGRPKGVMLTHTNVVANVRQLLELVEVREDDVFLSFLPLSHTFERTVGYYLAIAAGACVVYARSVQVLSEDLRSVRPTALISVPRIYERVYARVQEQIAQRGRVIARLFAACVELGWRRFQHAQGAGPALGPLEQLAWNALRPLFAERLLAQFGGRVRLAITGGAPMSEPIARCFLGLGLPLLQGYGMTESSPVVSAQVTADNDPRSVGRALRDIEVKIGADRELLVRGPTIMRGYWQRPEDTARAIDAEGWLHTGDQARIDGGRIYIEGRIKDIIVTSTGEKIAPADLELAITADPLFPQALVIGEGRPYLIALLVIDPAVWRREAASLGVDPENPAALAARPARDFALNRVRSAVCSFPAYATPRAVWMTHEPWTVAASLITPTLKLKRPALQQRFAEQIQGLYRGH
jgi:long-chain acyl-CoA synthetase